MCPRSMYPDPDIKRPLLRDLISSGTFLIVSPGYDKL